jgi:cobaltochelatase CobN
MLETARKGMWKATEQQLSDVASLHTELVKDFGSAASGFAGGNAKLQDYIAQKVDNASASEYKKELQKMKTAASADATNKGMVLKKDEINPQENSETNVLNGVVVGVVIIGLFVGLLLVLRRKRK